jgi:hypothetical protein
VMIYTYSYFFFYLVPPEWREIKCNLNFASEMKTH